MSTRVPDFERVEGGVAVRGAENEVQLVPFPEGFNPATFRALLTAYVAAYRALHRLPLAKEVQAEWARVPVGLVAEIMVTNEFRAALLHRGIDIGTAGLSSLQHAAVMAFGDPLDKRSAKAKLDALGVSTGTFSTWKKNPAFTKALSEQAKAIWREYAPEIKLKMAQQAEAGSFQHQQFLLESIGEGPKAKEAQSAKEVVLAMVGAIQRHCDPETRAAILDDMKLTLASVQLHALDAAE